MTRKITYGQILEEREILFRERLRILELWQEAGWIVSPQGDVELLDKKPPYAYEDCPIPMIENEKFLNLQDKT
jgi:hypothetical protein